MITVASQSLLEFDFDTYRRESTAISPGLNKFQAMDIVSLTQTIINMHHAGIREQVPVIYSLAQDAFTKNSRKFPQLAKLMESLFLFFDDLLFQLKKEEQIIFPNIIELAEKKLHEGTFSYSTFGILKELLADMKTEHDSAEKYLLFFRQLLGRCQSPEDVCASVVELDNKMKSFEQILIQHIVLETKVLIPRVIRMDEV